MVALAVVATIHTAAIVAFSLFLALIISSVVAFESADTVLHYTLWFAGAVALRAASVVALDTVAHRGGAMVKSELRRLSLHALERLGPSYMERRSSSQVTTLLAKGIDALDVYFGRYLPQLFLTAIQMPLILLVLWIADFPTGLAVTLALPVIPVFMVLIGWATQSVQKRQWDGMQALAKGFLDVVEGLPTLKIFGRQWRQVHHIRQVTGEFRRRTMAVLRVSFLSSFTLELAASLSVAIVAVSVGIRLIDGSLPLWLGLFVLLLIPELYLPLRQVGAQYHQAADGLAASEELFAILEAEPETAAITPPTTLWRPVREVALKEVTALRNRQPIHRPVSFRIVPGEIVALQGPSGAGKSSLFSALLGFTPYRGEITVDGHVVGPGALRDLISWVPQSPQLFSATIAANVSLGDGEPVRAEVKGAMRQAGLDGLDPELVLGVHGDGLSGGQAQRLALARAYYRMRRHSAQLLLLDEVTSALDPESEKVVWSGIEKLAQAGAMVVVISHRENQSTRVHRTVRVHPSTPVRVAS